jgi:hypothetical protein
VGKFEDPYKMTLAYVRSAKFIQNGQGQHETDLETQANRSRVATSS